MQDDSTGTIAFPFVDGVRRLAACVLKVESDAWAYAQTNTEAIDAHWVQAKQRSPKYFNGVVHLVQDIRCEGDRFDASLVRTDFKSYLYWREQGFPEAGVLDGFGSALIRSSDGHIILGRQRKGNVNSGLAYPPSGFIDEQDIGANGSIDIVESVVREVTEETGIEAGALIKGEGFHLTRSGAQLSIAVAFRVPISTPELVRFVERKIASSRDSELEAVIPVASRRDIQDLAMPRYARLLLDALFAEA
jgi:8-oxo-dGTP pyrophosphatase MutT (NUDIX family)